MAGKPTALVFGLGIGAILILWSEKPQHPAAAATPVTRTVVVRETVTRVVHAAAHSPVSGTDVVLITVAALVVFLVLALNRRA